MSQQPPTSPPASEASEQAKSNIVLFPGISVVTPASEITEALRRAGAHITVDPIIIGYTDDGYMEIIAHPDMDIERMHFMLSQALSQIMESTNDEDDEG